MKVVIEYNEPLNQLILPDGAMYTCNPGVVFEPAPDNDILSLVKAGLSAEDLINLKKADLL